MRVHFSTWVLLLVLFLECEVARASVFSKLRDYVAERAQETMTKIDQAANLDRDNDTLRKKVAELEVVNARLEHDTQTCQETKRAAKMKAIAKQEGGVESTRTIASLKTADAHLLTKSPREIFEEASKATAKGDFETAAKAYTFLVDSPESEEFQNAQAYYLAGVALFKVRNYKRAISYLDESVRKATGKQLAYAPRAMAWRVLCYARMGDKPAERKAAHELIQKYPKSKEARRLNRDA